MNEINPARPPVGEPDSRKAFWHAYLDWLATASEGDIEELASVLTANVTTEVRPLISALGAKWDKEAKGWYAPEGADLATLAKWLPKPGPELQSAPANALDDPRYREQLQGLKDVTAALNGEKSSPVRLSTDPKPETPGEKTWLAVPYPEKDKARASGCDASGSDSSWSSTEPDPTTASGELAGRASERMIRLVFSKS